MQVSAGIPECATRRGAWCSRWSAKVCGCDSSPAFADSFRHPQHPPRVPPRFADRAHATRDEASRPTPAKKFAQHGASSGLSAKKLAQRAIKHRFWAIFRLLGELFRAHAHIRPRGANFFAHGTQQHGDNVTTGTTAAADAGHHETPITTAHPSTATDETNNTTAIEKRTQNTHFSPAKAMTVSTGPPHRLAKATRVSTPHGHGQAKATPVSDSRTPG